MLVEKETKMFKVGDLIIYGIHGVCRVKDITKLDWDTAFKDRDYYVLEPLYKGDTVYVPVDNDKVYMRPVMTKSEVLELIDTMPDVDTEPYKARSIQQLARYYQAALDSHEMTDLIKLTKIIYTKRVETEKQGKQSKTLSQIDEKYMEHAENLLFGEIAAVLDIPRDEVLEYIDDRLLAKKMKAI